MCAGLIGHEVKLSQMSHRVRSNFVTLVYSMAPYSISLRCDAKGEGGVGIFWVQLGQSIGGPDFASGDTRPALSGFLLGLGTRSV